MGKNLLLSEVKMFNGGWNFYPTLLTAFATSDVRCFPSEFSSRATKICVHFGWSLTNYWTDDISEFAVPPISTRILWISGKLYSPEYSLSAFCAHPVSEWNIAEWKNCSISNIWTKIFVRECGSSHSILFGCAATHHRINCAMFENGSN